MIYKSDTLLSIVRSLMRPNGATVKELSRETGMVPRSIMRWLDRVAVQYPNLEGRALNGSREKHWRIPTNGISAPELTVASLQEVEELEHLAKMSEARNRFGEAAALRSIIARNEISGFVPAGTKISDFEYFIPRQFYIERINPSVLKMIARSLQEDRYLILDKYMKANGEEVSREVVPFILLTDLNRYLIGPERGGTAQTKSFMLARIRQAHLGEKLDKADMRKKISFVPDVYIRNSFSIWQNDKEICVKLLFSGRAAFPASQFYFSNEQKISKTPAGNTKVEFKARGIEAICNHLFTWGENVRVISPKSLRDAYTTKLKEILQVQK